MVRTTQINIKLKIHPFEDSVIWSLSELWINPKEQKVQRRTESELRLEIK
jgi:hypothetical protein